jgi:hypothetical protein
MKKTNIVVALIASLLSFAYANAGEMTVTGSMQATYQSETNGKSVAGVGTTGNPLGLNTDLVFTGTTEVLNGTAVTWTMSTDGTFLSNTGADHKLAFTNDFGTFQIGNSDDAANNVDDITPSAFEEANGSGSGTYATDFGSDLEGSMSVGYRNADVLGTGISVAYNYYPKLDGVTNSEKSASGVGAPANSAQSLSIATTLASLPVIGDTALGGLKLTFGYEENDTTLAKGDNKEGATIAANYAMGPISLGFQRKAYQPAMTTLGSKLNYTDNVYGIAFAANDALAISYNVYGSTRHNNTVNLEQETKAINLAYTVGGLTIGLQDAKTSNAGYSSGTDDDTRTISIKTAF